MVNRGVIQVMEGGTASPTFTIEENLPTGAYTRRTAARVAPDAGEGLTTSAPEDAPHEPGCLHPGGEQQMRIGRALMANPKMVLLDEPSMGLAPQIVEEVFEIVKDLNTKERVTFLLAEQNTNIALRYADYGYILENGRIVMDGEARRCARTRTSRSSTSAWAAATARASAT